MAEEAWQDVSQRVPPISWDATNGLFLLRLEGVNVSGVLEARIKPPIKYVIRIREVGAEEWGIGFETPLTGCSFVDLKPNTDYEAQVTAKNEFGEGPPTRTTVRTGPSGSGSVPNNFVPSHPQD